MTSKELKVLEAAREYKRTSLEPAAGLTDYCQKLSVASYKLEQAALKLNPDTLNVCDKKREGK